MIHGWLSSLRSSRIYHVCWEAQLMLVWHREGEDRKGGKDKPTWNRLIFTGRSNFVEIWHYLILCSYYLGWSCVRYVKSFFSRYVHISQQISPTRQKINWFEICSIRKKAGSHKDWNDTWLAQFSPLVKIICSPILIPLTGSRLRLYMCDH